MSRTGSVADGLAAAIETPKARAAGLRIRMHDGGAAVPDFSEQVSALEAAPILSSAAASPPSAETGEIADTGQKREFPLEAKDVAEPRSRLTGAARKALLLIDEAASHDAHITTSPSAAVDDTTSVQTEAEQAENESVVRMPISDIIALQGVPAEEAGHAGITRVPPVSVREQDAPQARLIAGHERFPTREAVSRANGGASSAYQPQPDTSPTPRRPGATPVVVRTAAEPDTNRPSPRAGDVPISVVRQEIHAPPVGRFSPGAQVANAVAAGLQRTDEPQSARAAIGMPPAPPPAGRVIRVLQVRLEPAELGTVSVRMTLDANGLELRIDARQPATADLIRRDQGALTRLLRSAGYDVEALTVHLAEPDRSAAAATSPAQHGSQTTSQQGTFQAHSGGSQPDGRSGGAHQSANRQSETAGTDTAESESGPSSADAPGPGGIYV